MVCNDYCLSVHVSECKKARDEGKSGIVKDFDGNEFLNEKEMLKHYGVSKYTFEDRKRRGWSLKQCLTGISDSLTNCRGGRWIDHLNNEYPTLKAMLERWHVKQRTYYNRLNHGRTIEECLTGIWDGKLHTDGSQGKWKDHKGNTYDRKEDMCSAYGISVAKYSRRINLGWSQQEALEGKKIEGYTDHKGNHFDMLEEMLLFWGVSKSTYYVRKRAGWTQKEILEGVREADTQ